MSVCCTVACFDPAYRLTSALLYTFLSPWFERPISKIDSTAAAFAAAAVSLVFDTTYALLSRLFACCPQHTYGLVEGTVGAGHDRAATGARWSCPPVRGYREYEKAPCRGGVRVCVTARGRGSECGRDSLAGRGIASSSEESNTSETSESALTQWFSLEGGIYGQGVKRAPKYRGRTDTASVVLLSARVAFHGDVV